MRKASPSAPGTHCEASCTNSYAQQRAPAVAADDQSGVLLARRRARRKQLVLRARNPGRHVYSHPCSRYHASVRRVPDAQIDLRRKAQFRARTADVERAALGEEVHPAPIDRRLEPERRAHRLARRARDPERPHRQVHVQRPHARFARDDRHQLVERRHLAPCEDVGSARGGRHGAGQAEAFDQIVDVRQMVEDLAVAEDDESPAGHAAEQLEQPAVAGPVDAGGPHDDQLRAARGGGLRQALAFQLGDLVGVARGERRILVGRRVLDVAVDAHRAAVDDAPHAGPGRRLDEPPHGLARSRSGTSPRAGPLADTAPRCCRRRRRRPRRPAASRRAARSPATTSTPAPPGRRRAQARAPARAPRRLATQGARARCPPVNPVAPVTRTFTAPPGS